MFSLRYYCKANGNQEVRNLLAEIEARHTIPYETTDLTKWGAYDEEKEREVYERDFKPRARLLKKRTGEPITRLRSQKGRYFVSIPGTIAIVKDEAVEWYALGEGEVMQFLNIVLDNGCAFLDECCTGFTTRATP